MDLASFLICEHYCLVSELVQKEDICYLEWKVIATYGPACVLFLVCRSLNLFAFQFAFLSCSVYLFPAVEFLSSCFCIFDPWLT